MIHACASGAWSPPPLPATVAEAIDATVPPRFDGSDFGRPMREAHFALDPAWTFINHGAFGAPCRLGTAAAAAWREHAERQPLQFIDRHLFSHLVESTRAVAEWVGASPAELVLVPNATTALNTVISSIAAAQLKAGDEVLTLDVGYGSVQQMVDRACQQSGAVPIVVHLGADLPASAAAGAILERVEAALTPRTRLAIIDDITSNTALSLPVAQLCDLCRQRGILTLIDGAHTLGSHPTAAMPWLEHADFAAANLHKWACGPRGVGFLWARTEHHHLLEPPILSHGYGAGFASSFIWSGSADYSARLALPSLIHCWWGGDHGLGPSVTYQQRLLAEAVELLGRAWGTGPLIAPSAGINMALVRLPLLAEGSRKWTGKAVQDALHFEHAIECPVKTIGHHLYVRISAAAYNERAEYERLADAVCSLAGMHGRVSSCA